MCGADSYEFTADPKSHAAKWVDVCNAHALCDSLPDNVLLNVDAITVH